MDGVDAALIETDGRGHIRPIGHIFMPYPAEAHLLFRAAEYVYFKSKGDHQSAAKNFTRFFEEYFLQKLELSQQQTQAQIKNLETWLMGQPTDLLLLDLEHIIRLSSYYHLNACRELCDDLGVRQDQIELIGYHGQTLYHAPQQGITVQAGHAAWIAEHFGCQVVHDFRSNDVKNGGQGAPFAPLYHRALAEQMNLIPLVVVNCGGIANVTIIPENPQQMLAFDTGPANCLLDRLIRQISKGKEHYDHDGRYSMAGKVNESVLKALHEKAVNQGGTNYFSLQAPKSLDSNDLVLIPELLELPLEEACRTLCAFTATSIINQTFQEAPSHMPEIPSLWLLSGGGWKNPAIFQEFCDRLQKTQPDSNIRRAEELNWNADSLEAELFAYLAVRSLEGLPLSLPGTTGVPKPVSGGVLHIPQSRMQ